MATIISAALTVSVISGTVVEPVTGDPVADAAVYLMPLGAVRRTDATGRFSFTGIEAGEYRLLLSIRNVLATTYDLVLDGTPIDVDLYAIRGDFDSNGKIDIIDLALYEASFGSSSGLEHLDFDGDGTIGISDVDLWYDTAWQTEGYFRHYTLLDDGEHSDALALFPEDSRWQAHHDGGDSWTVPSPNTSIYSSIGGFYSEKAYDFEYHLGSAAEYPFALFRLIFGLNESVIFDARDYESLTFLIKGENQPLIVSLKSEVTSDDWSEYEVRLGSVSDTWQSYTLNFKEDFVQPGWGETEDISEVLRTLQAIQFKADGDDIDRTLYLLVDNVSLINRVYEPPSHDISGTVNMNAATVGAATVELRSFSGALYTLSDESGGFTFNDVPSGSYELTAERPGYTSDVQTIEISIDSPTSGYGVEMQSTLTLPKPVSTGDVRILGNNLETDFDGDGNYETFFIEGVGYSPVPIGSWGDLIYPQLVYDRDMPLLADMNTNAIRTWGKAGQRLFDTAELNGIKVLAGFWASTSVDFFDPFVRRAIIAEFRDYVTAFKDHPALLAWSIGNEQNLVNGNNYAWYSLVQDLAVVAYEIEGADYHPVTSPNGDRTNIGNAAFLADDENMSYLDFWGMNLYKSDSEGFSGTFSRYASSSEKPLWISEYGIDAYDNRIGEEYEVEQASFAANRVREMYDSDICIGGTLMAYSDEWWKAGDPDSQDPGGYPIYAHPDGYSNEEWWGIFRVEKGNTIDILTARAIYDSLSLQFEAIGAK